MVMNNNDFSSKLEMVSEKSILDNSPDVKNVWVSCFNVQNLAGFKEQRRKTFNKIIFFFFALFSIGVDFHSIVS